MVCAMPVGREVAPTSLRTRLGSDRARVGAGAAAGAAALVGAAARGRSAGGRGDAAGSRSDLTADDVDGLRLVRRGEQPYELPLFISARAWAASACAPARPRPGGDERGGRFSPVVAFWSMPSATLPKTSDGSVILTHAGVRDAGIPPGRPSYRLARAHVTGKVSVGAAPDATGVCSARWSRLVAIGSHQVRTTCCSLMVFRLRVRQPGTRLSRVGRKPRRVCRRGQSVGTSLPGSLTAAAPTAHPETSASRPDPPAAT